MMSEKPALPDLHPIQWKILNNFRNSEELPFNKLKTFPVDPKNFVYHLQKLIERGLVVAITDKYVITDTGKLALMYFNDSFDLHRYAIDTFAGLFIKKGNTILVVRRKEVPYVNHTGIPVFPSRKDEFLHITAEKGMKSLGLTGALVRSLILETLYPDDESNGIITHSHMHVFFCLEPEGTITTEVDEGTLSWMTQEQLLAQEQGYTDSTTLISFFNEHPHPENIAVISTTDRKAQF